MKRRVLAAGHHRRQLAKHTGHGHELLRGQMRTHAFEDRPQDGALRLGKPRLSTQAPDAAIRLPCLQLPRIDDLLPLGQ